MSTEGITGKTAYFRPLAANCRVLLVANDIVPGAGTPVAAPGIRVHGLACGLIAHGFNVEVAIPSRALKSFEPLPPVEQWDTPYQTTPITMSALPTVIRAGEFRAAIITNSVQARHLCNAHGRSAIKPCRLVYDLFAPRFWERFVQFGAGRQNELQALRQEKIQALSLADAIAVNGEKKIGYAYGWLAQSDTIPQQPSIFVANMCLPLAFGPRRDAEPGAVKILTSGYMQPWQQSRMPIAHLARSVASSGATLHCVVGRHWGMYADADRSGLKSSLPGLEVHDVMTLDELVEFTQGVDVVVDVSERNPERELAMVTRSVVALACGKPLIHPAFTEVGAMVSAYDAGWVYDDEMEIPGIVQYILNNPHEIAQRAANARRLARTVIDPVVATRDLARFLLS